MSLVIRNISNTVKKFTPQDVRSAAGKITDAVSKGYRNGKKSKVRTIARPAYETAAIARELKNLKFAPKEYPAVIAAIVALIPVPSPVPIAAIIYGLGKVIQRFGKFKIK